MSYQSKEPIRDSRPFWWGCIGRLIVFVAFVLAHGNAYLLGQTVVAAQQIPKIDWEKKFTEMEVMMAFQGKGSCLPYDAGVLREAYARIPAFREGNALVAGNSSGSIPAAYFGCFGFNDDSVQYAIDRMVRGNRDAVRNMENVNNKMEKIARGKSTELSPIELREYIAFALGVSRWQDASSLEEIVQRSVAKPSHPCLIVACNKEVLEDRHPESRLAPGKLKEIDMKNMDVFWKPEVYAYYRNHPDRFVRDHPDLLLGPDRRIGKAVTFFVDASMYALLSRIPAEERQADLRLMVDASDVALAILASVSEPTYFPAVAEPQPTKILADERHPLSSTIRRRSYLGGYIISMPAQDVRRMLPGIRVLGTGWRHNPLVARVLLKNWLLADCDEVALRSEWWSDLEVNPDAEFESHIEFRDLTGEQEFEFGVRRARQLLDDDLGGPAFIKVPHFHFPAQEAIYPIKPVGDMFAKEPRDSEKPMLKTMRGMGPLQQPVGKLP